MTIHHSVNTRTKTSGGVRCGGDYSSRKAPRVCERRAARNWCSLQAHYAGAAFPSAIERLFNELYLPWFQNTLVFVSNAPMSNGSDA